MVINTNATEHKMIRNTQTGSLRRPHHSGQDPVQRPQLMHGRALWHYEQSRVDIEQVRRRVELEAANSIQIDIPLLTGNLDEDISILNIVA